MDLKRVHLIGVGGSGLSAIAVVLLERGVIVTGSDRQPSPMAQRVADAGGKVMTGHRPENVQGADVVLRSSAVPDDNVEVQAALTAGIPVLKRSEFLGLLMEGKQGIAVAGTNGKTTTTAMIAWMLTWLGKDPSYIIGGVSTNLGRNAHAGQGPHFVVEADEYDRMFLGLRPDVEVVTNVEHDHPDCYPTAEDFYAAFQQFTARLQPGGVLIACADDPGASRLLRDARIDGRNTVAYCAHNGSPGETCEYVGYEIAHNARGGVSFKARKGRSSVVRVSLQIPGQHNARNALAALAVADQLGIPMAEAAPALDEFRGTGRRFDLRGEAGGVVVIDDYAHHPTEIRVTLAAARMRYPGRKLWAVWQPHTYSRTRTLLDDFTRAFYSADHVVVTPVYAAREAAPRDGFSAETVASAIDHPDVHLVASLQEARDLLLEHLRPGDITLVLSAGDADQISTQVLQALAERDRSRDGTAAPAPVEGA